MAPIGAYAKVCAKNISGNSKIFLTEVANITSFTITADEISAVTATAGAFKEYQAEPESIQFTGAGVAGSSYSKVQSLTFKIAKKATGSIAAVKEINDALPCGIVVMRIDANGQTFVSGWSVSLLDETPYHDATDDYDSGTARADEDVQAYTIVMTANTDGDEIPLDTTQNASMVGGTAVYATFN